MITVKRFRRIERAVRDAGFADIIDWSETIVPPPDAEAFATEAIYVICNSGMRVTVAVPIFRRCMEALRRGAPATSVFGHPGKGPAIDEIWARRHELFDLFGGCEADDDKVAFCETLPWIGPVTKYHLAKNFGVDVAKPDVHMDRLAEVERTTPAKLCTRLSNQVGYRVATVDSILWRACAEGILSSSRYVTQGWRKAFSGRPNQRFLIEYAAAEPEFTVTDPNPDNG